MKIPFLSRLLEIKEWQIDAEKEKLRLLRQIKELLQNPNL